MSHEDYDDPDRGVVLIPTKPHDKLVDALSRCLWLFKAPGVKDAKALRGYEVEYVIRVGEAALKANRRIVSGK